MKVTIFATCSDPIERQDPFLPALQSYRGVADEVIIVDGSLNPTLPDKSRLWDRVVRYPWPEEFSWEFIGEQFQRGYEAAKGDWVIRMDLDYILHEQDIRLILDTLKNSDDDAMCFWKYQFILPDRYIVKSRLVNIINKKKLGDRIKLNGGGDLCQPTLDGEEITKYKEIKVPLYNYDFMMKEQHVVKKDIGRFARAWNRRFQDNKLGKDEENAFRKFMDMQLGRLKGDKARIDISEHPRWIKPYIRKLKPENFGYNLWGHAETCSYFP